MGRVLSIIGAGALALGGIAAATFGVGLYNARNINADGRAFVLHILPPVGTVFDISRILPVASDALRNQSQSAAAIQLGSELRRLGVIKTYDQPADGGFRVNYGPAGKMAVANYIVTVHAENGDAKLGIGLLKRGDDAWKVNGVHLHKGDNAATGVQKL